MKRVNPVNPGGPDRGEPTPAAIGARAPGPGEERIRMAVELAGIVAGLGWPELIVLGQRVGPGEERWRKFCDFPPPWLPAALEVAKAQRRLAADYPF